MFYKIAKIAGYTVAVLLAFASGSVYATMNVGSVANTITSNFGSLTQLITAGSYIAGTGFGVGTILKFKQHKDNPTQIPIGTPISMAFIAAALLFFPTILGVSGQSIFGSDASVASPTGTIFSTTGS